MKRASLILALACCYLLAGCCVLGGCDKPESETLHCQWSIITMQGGISVVDDGNPAEKSVEELIESGVGFTQRIEREMFCKPASSNTKFITDPASTPPRKKDGTWAYNISE